MKPDSLRSSGRPACPSDEFEEGVALAELAHVLAGAFDGYEYEDDGRVIDQEVWGMARRLAAIAGARFILPHARERLYESMNRYEFDQTYRDLTGFAYGNARRFG